MIVMDEVEGKRGRQRRCPRYSAAYDPEEAERAKKAPPPPTYLELLRDHFHRTTARKQIKLIFFLCTFRDSKPVLLLATSSELKHQISFEIKATKQETRD